MPGFSLLLLTHSLPYLVQNQITILSNIKGNQLVVFFFGQTQGSLCPGEKKDYKCLATAFMSKVVVAVLVESIAHWGDYTCDHTYHHNHNGVGCHLLPKLRPQSGR